MVFNLSNPRTPIPKDIGEKQVGENKVLNFFLPLVSVIGISRPPIPEDIGHLMVPCPRHVISQSGGRCCLCIGGLKENIWHSFWDPKVSLRGTPFRTTFKTKVTSAVKN